MFPENFDRNILIYDLWKKGYTINEMSFETGIPRSTVGYYVRKFNKHARRGDPIVFPHKKEKQNEEKIALKVTGKFMIQKRLKEFMMGPDALNNAEQFLRIIKLVSEVEKKIFPTEDEEIVYYKYLNKIIKPLTYAWDKVLRTKSEKSASLSDTQKKKRKFKVIQQAIVTGKL
jgi:hypothetical protein